MNWESNYGLNRTLCDVLYEMRQIIPNVTHTEAHSKLLLSLVEEVQVFGDRMEASLNDLHDVETLHKKIKKLNHKYKVLKDKVEPDTDG